MSTYIEDARHALLSALGDTEERWTDESALLDAYTLLVLVRGQSTTLADIHDAWAVVRQRPRPAHRDLVPFNELSAETQSWDEPYRAAVVKAAATLAGVPALPPLNADSVDGVSFLRDFYAPEPVAPPGTRECDWCAVKLRWWQWKNCRMCRRALAVDAPGSPCPKGERRGQVQR